MSEQEDLSTLLTAEAPFIEDKGMMPWVFTNDKTNPAPFQILNLFYKGVFSNTVGVMHAKHKETGNLELLLVGLTRDEGGDLGVYPLARLLSMEDSADYLPPDGNGGYIEPAERAE